LKTNFYKLAVNSTILKMKETVFVINYIFTEKETNTYFEQV